MFRFYRVFFTSARGRSSEVSIGSFVTSQMLNSRGVYNAHQAGFPLHLLGDQLQKQVRLGTERMGDCGECRVLPDVCHRNTGPTAGEMRTMWI